MNYKEYQQLLRDSLKSEDTEEWIDMWFTRPVGLLFALMWRRLGVHPNVVTILSIFLGMGAAWMFWHTPLIYNVAGILLLMLANLCDSTDGQLARLTGQHSFVGRVLDGLAGDIWFVCIYVALCLRMQGQSMPCTELSWEWRIWLLGAVAGIACHMKQSSLSDYYRQIHLFFLKGAEGSELDNYEQQRMISKSLPRRAWLARIFYWGYARYCRSQERRTPCFQIFFERFGKETDNVRECFLDGSRPLMKYANILTFNTRAIILYITCLWGCPWVYFLLEATLFQTLYLYMRRRHERLCASLITDEIRPETGEKR